MNTPKNFPVDKKFPPLPKKVNTEINSAFPIMFHETPSASLDKKKPSFRLMEPRSPQQPLPDEILTSFAPQTMIFGSELINIRFAEEMELFDTREFRTDKEGLQQLQAKLQTVKKIRCLRLTPFQAESTKPHEIDSFIQKAFPPAVWGNVEILEIDFPPSILSELRNLLEPHTSLKSLILHRGDGIASLPVFPSLQFLNLPFHDPPFDFLKQYYGDTEILCSARRFKPVGYESLDQIRQLPSEPGFAEDQFEICCNLGVKTQAILVPSPR